MDKCIRRGNKDILGIYIDVYNLKEDLRKNLQLVKKVFFFPLWSERSSFLYCGNEGRVPPSRSSPSSTVIVTFEAYWRDGTLSAL